LASSYQREKALAATGETRNLHVNALDDVEIEP